MRLLISWERMALTTVSILFVCTGNICRSPTAEGVFRRMVDEAGLGGSIHIDSAGTSAFQTGSPPEPQSVMAAARRSYDLSRLRARVLEERDCDRFDLALAMANTHALEMRRQWPPALRQRIRLFMDFASVHHQQEVPDPYGGGPRGFESVLDMIEDGCVGLLDHVRGILGDRGID